MTTINLSEPINHQRRRFLGAAAMTITAAQFGMFGCAESEVATATDAAGLTGAAYTSFPSLKQIDAGLLNIGYAEAGPVDGPAVVLLHGWPYDIHSFVDVAPILAAAGFHVIIPYSRGYGTTSFLSSATMRNAQQTAVALDVIAL